MTEEQQSRYMFACAILWFIGGVVLMAVCAGCVVKPQPQTVSIVYKPAMPSCYVQEMPEPPKLLELNYEDDDVVRRVFVHYLQGNEIIGYEQELATWAGQVRECLMMMQGVTP